MLALTSSFDSSTVESRVSSFPETRRTFDALYLHSCNVGHTVLRTMIVLETKKAVATPTIPC